MLHLKALERARSVVEALGRKCHGLYILLYAIEQINQALSEKVVDPLILLGFQENGTQAARSARA
jgi:hypothetical protein